jgi:hypothetical protein
MIPKNKSTDAFRPIDVLSTDMGNTIVSDSGVGLVILPGGVSGLGFIISRWSEGSGARVLSSAS